MTTWKFHKFCLRMPVMSPEVRAATKSGMKRYGFRPNHPVMMFRGEVVDGRHRLQIAEELKAEGVKVEPVFEEWTPPEDAKTESEIEAALDQYTIIENALRRSITAAQMAQIIVRDRGLAELPAEEVNVSQVARETGIGRAVVSKALAVGRASPELSKQVATGETTLKEAYRATKRDTQTQNPKGDPKPEERRSRDPFEEDHEEEAISPTQAGVDAEFQRLSERLGQIVTCLSRMKVIATALEKRVGRGEHFIRTLTAAHDDCERWGRLLREWSARSGVK